MSNKQDSKTTEKKKRTIILVQFSIQQKCKMGETHDFKQMYANHKVSLKNNIKQLSPDCSRKKSLDIIQKCSIYERGNRCSDLCLTEKVCIAK